MYQNSHAHLLLNDVGNYVPLLVELFADGDEALVKLDMALLPEVFTLHQQLDEQLHCNVVDFLFGLGSVELGDVLACILFSFHGCVLLKSQ